MFCILLNGVSKKHTNLPAKGGPIIAAVPLNKLRRPNELVSLSSPTISTKIIEVNEMYAAKIEGKSALKSLKKLNLKQ